MFSDILVPVDLTDRSRRAVEVARDLTLESGGRMTLLHVIQTLDLPFEELADFYGRLEAQATEKMEELAAPVREAGVDFQAHISYGRRAEEIVQHAQESETDLIVLTSHRVDLSNPGASWTTTSYKVAILAQCPVLLVKGAA